MLQLEIKQSEKFDELTQTFVTYPGKILSLEHSLISVSKWEAKWHKPFISKEEKTTEQTIDYIRCMSLTPIVDDRVLYGLTNDNIQTVNDYIDDPMTATWFNDKAIGASKRGNSGEVVTSELIYYWMIALQIPMECQKWHLNRLLTLIKVCNIKNTPPKKMSKRALMNRNRAINEMRKAEMGTHG